MDSKYRLSIYGLMCIKLLFVLIIGLSFIACSQKNLTTKSFNKKFVLFFKSRKIKFNDVVILKFVNSHTIQIKAFNIGRSIANIVLNSKNNKICLNDLCFSSINFNKTYLVRTYPAKMLYSIFRGQPIFAKKNLEKVYQSSKDNRKKFVGFNQKIDSINYKVRDNLIYFKDKRNNITIRMQRL